jgi:hypothetical protein
MMAEAAHRFTYALDSRGAYRLVQMLAVVALLLSLLIGFQQFQLTNCLAEYNEGTAKRSAIVADIATEDRKLDLADRAATEQVEAARGDAEASLSRTLLSLGGKDEPRIRAAFADLLSAQQRLSATRTSAERTKAGNAATRRQNEEQRKKNPVPAPPSQRC